MSPRAASRRAGTRPNFRGLRRAQAAADDKAARSVAACGVAHRPAAGAVASPAKRRWCARKGVDDYGGTRWRRISWQYPANGGGFYPAVRAALSATICFASLANSASIACAFTAARGCPAPLRHAKRQATPPAACGGCHRKPAKPQRGFAGRAIPATLRVAVAPCQAWRCFICRPRAAKRRGHIKKIKILLIFIFFLLFPVTSIRFLLSSYFPISNFLIFPLPLFALYITLHTYGAALVPCRKYILKGGNATAMPMAKPAWRRIIWQLIWLPYSPPPPRAMR
ncbi:MAG: hypothetical protein Pg6A_16640 [Termitinemataceae bacterium]|nr:MAG: hypothetical protein Pg6A_16640 [Termitinemataceae bacterium]